MDTKTKIIYTLIGIIIGFILSSALFYVIQLSDAHPGRTAADGCHYCRTNCDSWGVPWNERHCGGGSVPLSPIPESEPDIISYNEVSAIVNGIIDGDTIHVNIDGTNYRVRLIGIDTPESVDPRKPVECFSKEATEKIKSLILNKSVTLKRGAISDNKDIYDRLLRYVYLGDQDINAEMIKQGYAYAYLKYSFEPDRMTVYKIYENQARDKELGLWAPGVCGSSTATDELPPPLSEDSALPSLPKLQNEDEVVKNSDQSLMIVTIIGAGLLVFILWTRKTFGNKKSKQR